MRPYTKDIPKALIRVNGTPFMAHQIQWLARQGIEDFVVSIGHLGQMIKDYAEDGSRWGVRITYCDEGENLLGTGGAVRLAVDKGLLQDRFILTWGDSFLPVDFQAIWTYFLNVADKALMVVYRNNSQWDKSNVIFRNHKVELYDKFYRSEEESKFDYIDYGISCFHRSIIEEHVRSDQKYDLAELFYLLSKQDSLAGYEIQDRFYEIGSPKGLKDLEEYLSNQSS